LQFLSSFDGGNQSLAWEMEWATMEGGRERVFVPVLVDLNVGEPKERHWGSVKEIFISSWGPTAIMGGTAALPTTARFLNCFNGCYGRV
jgi:hypothetical protein